MSYSSGGGGSLHGNSDVALNTPVMGNVLSYDASIAKWKNAASVSSIGGRTGDVTLTESDVSGLTGDLTARAKTTNGGQETVATVTASGSGYTVNAANGNLFFITLTATCTLAITGAVTGTACSLTLALKQDSTGSRTVAWPSAVLWSNGTVPTLSTTGGKVDFISLLSVDGGTTWYGFTSGLNY